MNKNLLSDIHRKNCTIQIIVNYQHSETSASPLMIAAGRGKLAIMEILLKLSANINLKDDNGWYSRQLFIPKLVQYLRHILIMLLGQHEIGH